MKVKMVDIARYLGVSKSTVSLAVNDKPGVNEDTKREILSLLDYANKHDGQLPMKNTAVTEGREAITQKENIKEAPTVNGHSQIVKIVIANHQKDVLKNAEMDLWTEVLVTFDREAKKYGWMNTVTYLDMADDPVQVIEDCNQSIVAGVILFATEMEETDMNLIQNIHKPMIFYDYEVDEGTYSSICIDNKMAVRLAFEHLYKKGYRKFQYLCTGKNIYNFQVRRDSFKTCLAEKGLAFDESMMIPVGNTVEEMTKLTEDVLMDHPKDTALILENFQISIAVIYALNKIRAMRGSFLPQADDNEERTAELPIAGIDEIPTYLQGMAGFARVKIPHVDRAVMAMDLLHREIINPDSGKVHIYASPKLIL